MAENFQNKVYSSDTDSTAIAIQKIASNRDLSNAERARLDGIKRSWDFYEGYQWEDFSESDDSPQVTVNYCRLFVDKFVAFELGKGFNIEIPKYLDNIEVTVDDPKIVVNNDKDNDGFIEDDERNSDTITDGGGSERPAYEVRQKYLSEFIEDVWKSNNKEVFTVEMGQMKAVTGDAWVHVAYISGEELGLRDPFNEFEKGKITVDLIPSQYCFPKMNRHDKDALETMLIMYPMEKEVQRNILVREVTLETVLFKQYWTLDRIRTYEDDELISDVPNPYGFIPFQQIKNFPEAGRIFGISDLDDVIPLNIEYNVKNSDVSEIIDYHAAPITCIFGAKIGNLEKGANKVWGGLPKDARVENLQMQGDLVASQQYISHMKTAMCEVGNMSENMLGGVQSISNTSGVALHYMNMPLEERANVKRLCTARGLANVNKMIIMMGLVHGLIRRPDDVSLKDFLQNTVTLPDTLPKDELLELQKIQMEMMLHLECRHGALERLGREGISDKLAEIDTEAEAHPEIFNSALQQSWYDNQMQINSGMMNGETPQENLRTETTGQNGGAEV